ncbi:MAG: hypothetical protein R3F43_32955, partial [bacterium]
MGRFLTLCCLALPAVALAGPGARELAALERGPAADQLERDLTVLPPGMGAVFVPASTRPGVEPPILVLFRGERVAWGQTGERLVVPPGDYEVVVGQGPRGRQARVQVRVAEGVTTMAPPFFSALRVSAVDLQGRRLALDYGLEQGDAPFGASTTVKAARYDATATWLLPPGRVTIALRDGDRTDRSAVEVDLAAGQRVRYRLVVDGGRLVRAELAERELVVPASPWRARWVVGGDASFSRQAGQLGAHNGDFLRAGIFSTAEVGLDTRGHLLLLTGSVHQAWIGLGGAEGESLSTRKFSDELDLELLYNPRFGGTLGPYARIAGRTSLFETTFQPTVDTEVVRRDGAGIELGRSTLAAGDTLELLPGLAPLDLRAAAGLAATVVDTGQVELRLRAGAAVREARFGGGSHIEAADL